MFDHNYLRFDQNKYKFTQVRHVCSLYHVEMHMALPRKFAERIIQAMKG